MFILVLYFLLSFSLTKIIIPPPNPNESFSILIIVQGASISPESYHSLAQTIQKTTKLSLWVGISDFLFDMPDPLTLGSQLEDIKTIIEEQAGGKAQKIFYAGHSLGGILLSKHLSKIKVDGVILMGSFLTRNMKEIRKTDGKTIFNFESKVLTLGAELDGNCRITRIAEAYYHSILNNISPEQFPVVVIPKVYF